MYEIMFVCVKLIDLSVDTSQISMLKHLSSTLLTSTVMNALLLLNLLYNLNKNDGLYKNKNRKYYQE